MMKRHNPYTFWVAMVLPACVWLCTACSMMETDLSHCPPVDTGLYISFKYDYNIQRSDMFRDHVGGVTAYIFDAQDKFVTQQSENNVTLTGYVPLKAYDYQMRLDLPEGTYRVVALAHQKAYEETLLGKGAKYRRVELSPGDDISKLQVLLDRQSTSDASSRVDISGVSQVVHENLPLDTLFHAISQTITRAGAQSSDTLSMTRNTKMLTIGLRQLDDQANISTDDFEVYILDNNGTTNYDNSVEQDEDIMYSPHDTWTTEFTDTDGNVLQRAAHYGINFNRLIYYDTPSDNALLVIRNKATQAEVAVINLPDCLAQGRNAVERYQYSAQEFLDREYNYKLDFFLKGDSWLYIDLSISILSWSKRIQNIDF